MLPPSVLALRPAGKRGWPWTRTCRSSPSSWLGVLAARRLRGAPRRNRTGDPILAIGNRCADRPSPGRARPLGPKLWVLLRRRDALTFRSCCLRERRALPASSSDCVRIPSTIGPLLRRMPSVGGAVRVIGPQAHRGLGRPEHGRAVDLGPRRRIPRSGHTQARAMGPGGGRGRTRLSMSKPQRSGDEPLPTRPVPGPLLSIGCSNAGTRDRWGPGRGW
jgi:hypothetical protein